MGPAQVNQRRPEQHDFDFRKKMLTLGPLLRHGLLIVSESELPSAHQPDPDL